MRVASWMLAALVAVVPVCGIAQTAAGPYKILRTVKVGGEGGFDYVYADESERKLYIARSGPGGRMTVFNLDTLAPAGEIPNMSAHGAAVDPKTGHGFGTSKPVAMWDAKTLAPIKTIEIAGNPDGLLDDPTLSRVYILSHASPNVTVLDAKDGAIVGTVDLGGAPEQAALDGKGHLYIDLEDKGSIAVVDTKTLKLTATYDLKGKGGTCAGLAIDAKAGVLFAACREPRTLVALSAADGTILDTLPIGMGTDGAVYNPKTGEVFSSNGDGTLTIVKKDAAGKYAVEQTLTTLPRAKTLALDRKTGRILLITAEFGPAPAAVAGGRPGRAPMLPGTFMILEVGR